MDFNVIIQDVLHVSGAVENYTIAPWLRRPNRVPTLIAITSIISPSAGGNAGVSDASRVTLVGRLPLRKKFKWTASWIQLNIHENTPWYYHLDALSRLNLPISDLILEYKDNDIIMDPIPSFPYLTTLDIHPTDHQLEIAVEAAESIATLPSLRRLYLGGVSISNDALPFIQNIPTLAFMEIEQGSYDNMPFTRNSPYTHIRIMNNDFMWNFLDNLPVSLTQLDLRGIGDVNATALNALERTSLTGLMIENLTFRLEAPGRLGLPHTLKTLRLDNTLIGMYGDQIKKDYPDVTIMKI